MKIVFMISAALVTIGGLLLLFAPKMMIKIGEAFNRMATTDDIILLKRHIIGVFLLVIGIYLLYTSMNMV
ncbi:MAG: hypothetical protein HN729_03760 [Candidatus Marinimicrobia bacterium]|jgi:uncharacterized protein YjeT (DUF2065 family)|nr:hypothetical protein [Candidatus Neomarinimicrobiota bacterium]MBT3634848.1 hypothetical protein [Candidatus Neomarinimicrobiota bacterium]MBT3682790.1 hypothetical protein [Candidatus Neomarinimicrobiota bacterium]MBT3759555.1 hypothetical protein [Candidatus Neomarinimicrobiota bacterium]MBT3894573.1 hypothetical protein [Candidatus Neomarinimicrobiota bacterium]